MCDHQKRGNLHFWFKFLVNLMKIRSNFIRNPRGILMSVKWPFLGQFWHRKSRVHGSLAKALRVVKHQPPTRPLFTYQPGLTPTTPLLTTTG